VAGLRRIFAFLKSSSPLGTKKRALVPLCSEISFE
jgi:hypothetical protein